jgi:hypothetical protein
MYTEVYIEYKQEYTELYKCCTGGKSGTCKLMWGQPVEATIKGTIDAPNGLLHARITIPLGVPRTRVGANIGLGMDLDYESNSELMNFVRRAVARGDVREVVEWSTGGGGPAGMTRVVSHVKCRSDEAPFPGSPVFKDW